MTLLADGRLHFDNNLKASWSDPILSDIPTYAQYLQWVDEPREDKDQEPDEPVPPRVYTEEEVAQFHAELVRLHQQRRGLLVLDLDHTLVHCTRKKDNAGNAPSFTIGQEVWFFDFRPGLVQFLQTLSPYFEIHLYTFATRPYAEHLINAISSLMPDPNQMRFRTLFTRNECLDKKRKSISEMFPDNSMVLVVDDNKGAVWTENDNLIKIPPYYHFGKKAKRSPNDQHLIVVSSFLKTYHHIFFEQRTCETKHILAKMRELAAIMCPLDLVAIEKEREKRKEKHRDSERKKEEKAQKVREKAERERLRREKEQQQLSVVISGQQYAHVQPMQFMASGEMSHTAPCRVAPTVQAAPVMQLQQPYPSPPTALSPPVTLHVQSGAQPRLPVPCAVHPRGAASSPTSTEAVEEKHSPPRNNLAPNFLHQEDSSQSLPCAMTPHPSPLPNRPNLRYLKQGGQKGGGADGPTGKLSSVASSGGRNGHSRRDFHIWPLLLEVEEGHNCHLCSPRSGGEEFRPLPTTSTVFSGRRGYSIEAGQEKKCVAPRPPAAAPVLETSNCVLSCSAGRCPFEVLVEAVFVAEGEGKRGVQSGRKQTDYPL